VADLTCVAGVVYC